MAMATNANKGVCARFNIALDAVDGDIRKFFDTGLFLLLHQYDLYSEYREAYACLVRKLQTERLRFVAVGTSSMCATFEMGESMWCADLRPQRWHYWKYVMSLSRV